MESYSTIMCCIAGCERVGTRSLEGKLFCYPHWVEEMNEIPPIIETNCEKECSGCDVVPFKCCVKDCNSGGIITQIGTQNHYCVNHAWKVDRPDQCAGKEWYENTEVSESVAEECKRELEEGKKGGWKRR